MIRSINCFLALALLCSCSPLTYQPRVVQVQQLPSHPLPAGSTYAVVVPPTSVGAAQLTDGITIPGLTRASTPDTAEVTINASVGQATVTDLTVATATREAIISSSSGPTEYQVYSYTGNISIPSQLTITAKNTAPSCRIPNRPRTRSPSIAILAPRSVFGIPCRWKLLFVASVPLCSKKPHSARWRASSAWQTRC